MGKKKKTKAAAGDSPAAAALSGRPKWWGKFILELATGSSAAAAARAAGVAKSTAHQAVDEHPDLADEADQAREAYRSEVRQLVRRVAGEGIKLPIYASDGNLITGYETKWDARVLLALANAVLPEFQRASGADANPNRPTISPADADEIVDAIARRVAERSGVPAIVDR